MRKLLSITLLSLIILGLAGCGGSGGNTSIDDFSITDKEADYNLTVSIEFNKDVIYANEYVTFYAKHKKKAITTYRWLLNGDEVGNEYKFRKSNLNEGNYTLEVFICCNARLSQRTGGFCKI